MNKRSHIHKKADSSASNPVRSQFQSRPFIAQAQPQSQKPLMQTARENQEFQQQKFEATKLELQAKYGTITSEGQERLTVLQAKMSGSLQSQLEHASRFGSNFANIPISRPEARSQQAVQTKLTIGEPGDKYEQEADRVAAQVVNQIHAPVSQQAGENVQREKISEEEKDLQMKPMLQLRAAVGGMTATADLETGIQQARGSGQPLADSIREPMEQAFGANFSKVKVHTDTQSDQLNRSIQARAFTTGQDVFFRQGEYNPGSRGGQELIAHELTHVVQQKRSVVQRSTQPEPMVEQHATARSVSPLAGEGFIQRYIEIEKFFPLLDKLNLDNTKRHRTMHWNSMGHFDSVRNDEHALKNKILEWVEISSNVGHGELAPGQEHKNQTLPDWLNYFSEFEAELPKNWGKLTFQKAFNRMTENGWISDNVVLPKAEFPQDVAVHVILAVNDGNCSSEQVIINPHVTVRVKKVQDKYDQIALLNDRKTKTNENSKLGREGTQNSLSVGIKTDRDKPETNAIKNIGKTMEELKEAFTKDWLCSIVEKAKQAAVAKDHVEQTQQFAIKGEKITYE